MRPLARVSVSLFCLIAISCSMARDIDVQGHRGARARRPENTLAAFDYALKVGVDTIELDLNVTRDGEVVVLHEQFIPTNLCLGPDGQELPPDVPVYSLNLEKIKTFDCGSRKNPDFPDQVVVPGERIPTLDEVFAYVEQSNLPRAKTVRFNIETKIRPDRPDLSPNPEEFVRKVLDIVRKHGMTERTTLQSFDPRTLIVAGKMEPGLRLSFLFAAHGLSPIDVKQFGTTFVSPNVGWITEEKVNLLHAANVGVLPWTANTRPDWERLILMGVDGIITDDPEGLLEFLHERGLRLEQK